MWSFVTLFRHSYYTRIYFISSVWRETRIPSWRLATKRRRRFLTDLGKDAFGSQNTFTFARVIVCSRARGGVQVPTPSGVLVVSVLLINGFDFVSGSKLTYALKREKHKIHCGNENLPDSLQLGKVRKWKWNRRKKAKPFLKHPKYYLVFAFFFVVQKKLQTWPLSLVSVLLLSRLLYSVKLRGKSVSQNLQCNV